MLTVKSLTKTYVARGGVAPVAALRGVTFDVKQGDVFALLGPSGCGKTTLLQCIAGLEKPTAGTIEIAGSLAFDAASRLWVPPNRRGIGMVFQSYAIWPHMNVFDNVAFPLAHCGRRVSKSDIARRVNAALAMVKLSDLEARPASNLSGGQQQRVALARAIVYEPKLLLLDEPLSNLDAKLRENMRLELRQLIRELGITTLFVTHDQSEAMVMADKIALMRDGLIVQSGSPTEIYTKPESAFAADFVAHSNLIPGQLVTTAPSATIRTSLGVFSCSAAPKALAIGDAGLLVVRRQGGRRRDLSLWSEATPNYIRGTVLAAGFLGDMVDVSLRAGDQELYFLLNADERPTVGEDVLLEVPVDHCVVVGGET